MSPAEVEAAVLAIVSEAAAAGAKCPSNKFLGAAVGVSEYMAQCALVRLDQRCAIKIIRGVAPFRKVEVPGVGTTAWNCRVTHDRPREPELATHRITDEADPWTGDCFAAHDADPGDRGGSVSRPATHVPTMGVLA